MNNTIMTTTPSIFNLYNNYYNIIIKKKKKKLWREKIL